MKNKNINGVRVSKHVEEDAVRPYVTKNRPEGRPPQNGKMPIPNAEVLWKQVEDLVVPQLRLSVIDHVVYINLFRHIRLEGKRRLKFSIPGLARNVRLSCCPTREAVRRLAAQGALRIIERSRTGHVADVRLPAEIRRVRPKAPWALQAAGLSEAAGIEELDFLKIPELRRAIHSREGGRCFYCQRRLSPRMRCLDHVVPQALMRCNSYRNLVSACTECNSQKGERSAEKLLQWLFRERRLTAADLASRFHALERLVSGELRPALPSQQEPGWQDSQGENPFGSNSESIDTES